MSFRTQTIEWDVPESEVLSGIPVGLEVELSPSSNFSEVTYRFNTFGILDEFGMEKSANGRFFYSIDDGDTWLDFTLGEAGQSFSSAYKIRLVINTGDGNSFIFAKCDNTIYKISGDSFAKLQQFVIANLNTTDLDIDSQTNRLYLSGNNQTIYTVNTDNSLRLGTNSFNVHKNPLGIVIDGPRDRLWQINNREVEIRNSKTGQLKTTIDITFDIDIDFSSSSSSLDSSSSSS